jgi:hypothetical protein
VARCADGQLPSCSLTEGKGRRSDPRLPPARKWDRWLITHMGSDPVHQGRHDLRLGCRNVLPPLRRDKPTGLMSKQRKSPAEAGPSGLLEGRHTMHGMCSPPRTYRASRVARCGRSQRTNEKAPHEAGPSHRICPRHPRNGYRSATYRGRLTSSIAHRVYVRSAVISGGFGVCAEQRRRYPANSIVTRVPLWTES